MAIASLFCGRPVRSEVGMTGEVTLRGRVMPVGGIKMKVLAAHRAGLSTVILPKRNERDLEDLPEDVSEAMTFVAVERIDEALKVGLLPDGALSDMPEMSEWLRSIGATKGGSLN
jgi:ATP-dependent Lon protease